MNRPLAAVPSDLGSRFQAVLAELEQIAGEFGREALPDYFAGLEHAKRVGELRLYASVTPASKGGPLPPLLTVDDVADLFVVSTKKIYEMSKGELRSASIQVGDATLRFDPQKIARFIEARRR